MYKQLKLQWLQQFMFGGISNQIKLDKSIKIAANNFYVNLFCVMIFFAEFSFVCSYAFKGTFPILLKKFNRNNEEKRCLSINILYFED